MTLYFHSKNKKSFVLFSQTLYRIPHLNLFLHDMENCTIQRNTVLGWGHKPTADKARRYAAEHNLPYIAVEDGFLRSLDLGCRGAQPLSLVVDHTGIYYDASGPSDLEDFLNSSGWETPELMDSARLAMREIIRHSLSKYNHAPESSESVWGDGLAPRVLVLDQTVGDASVTLGMADEECFHAMLEKALTVHPHSHVCVKTHPDVIAGKKKGYLTEYATKHGVKILAVEHAPLSLLSRADVVYTVTSQMGFEALMLDKEVHCFGMPFYAGWGLTNDMKTCSRRKRQRSLEEVFTAAYLLYARYVNPIRSERCDIHDTISLLTEQRRQNESNRCFHACVGFRWWKRPYARAYLQSTGGQTVFYRNAKQAIYDAWTKGGELVTWSSNVDTELQKACDERGIRLARMEDGFIRSVGLGSNFNWPYSLVVDRKGIYYDPSLPSELEDILNAIHEHPEHAALLKRAATLCAIILEKGLTKYNTGFRVEFLPKLPKEKTIILVPGQVEDDASVRCGGFGMTNLDLLRAAREARPDAFIIYKPHPDVESGNRQGALPDTTTLHYADSILHDFPMGSLLPLVNEVHTLTSQTGFEALLRGVKVCTYGGPFYAGWGLTEDNRTFPRRKARLNLNELVAGALLLYPSYYDWQTRNFCRAEDVCCRLLQPDGQMRGRVWTRFVTATRGFLQRIGR
ncbi:capsular polysaccharide biosynthesis protein [Nitratidesulfovibrio vulgaris]|uniref:Capsule polysaccharide biosynthesis n=1 Tax=Nitratidesulfovibrio vulgaris (strain DP4) TaxID=391774 RepID=A0A0H3AB99_NITV4|nr:capsular polysaccharide biosynthesis protein [Nitratidesulfovibrio vulgaris]ABM29610.1 Capsule polysaccharide biosynthesis [Nitratidesulfovibrio vulgaris DP4]